MTMADRTAPDTSDSSPEDLRSIGAPTTISDRRLSRTSVETGESSKRSSFIKDVRHLSSTRDDGIDPQDSLELPGQKGTTRRSHKSAGGGGFLLSKPIHDPIRDLESEGAPRRRDTYRDVKGKQSERTPEKRQSKRKSDIGLGIGSSPLAAVVNATPSSPRDDEVTQDVPKNGSTDQTSHPTLDLNSKQIVSLALNLNESRRIAQRRNITTPLPPTTSGFGEGFAGGSLRHHLQQQRRSSRNISPKPDRGERSFTASPRVPSQSQRQNSPLQMAFEETGYQYQFSASTLARAEKAKNSIELMAQYRRLLQYVPPLKPGNLSRVVTATPPGSAQGSPTSPKFSSSAGGSIQQRSLGRLYNPLQYIRNRTVRARERKTIDGEAQGFGLIGDVKAWVDEVSSKASEDDFRTLDCVPLPPLNGNVMVSQASPNSTVGRASSKKVARPRIGWMTNPADMLADVYWLEQGDNKKSIEDHQWQRIFPQDHRLAHQPSKIEEHNIQESVEPKDEASHSPESKVDSKVSSSKAMKQETDAEYDSGSSKLKQKLHNLGHFHDAGRSRPDNRLSSKTANTRSDTSDSGSEPRRRDREKSGTSNYNDTSTDVLEKQMMELLRKDAQDSDLSSPLDSKTRRDIHNIETPRSKLQEELEIKRGSSLRSTTESPKPEATKHRRNGSLLRSDDSQNTSGRNSLEVPDFRGRRSLDSPRHSTHESPQLRAKAATAFVPPLGMSLSPGPSRASSPTRKPLDRIKSKIPFTRDRSPERGSRKASIEPDDIPSPIAENPLTPDRVPRRATSPVKPVVARKTVDSTKPAKSQLSQRREHEILGIRGLFKSGRSNVSKIGDMIWKKNIPSAHVRSSSNSTDVSDDEGYSEQSHLSRTSSREVTGGFSPIKERKSFDLPSFVSPFERRGRDKRVKTSELGSPESGHLTARQRHDSLRTSRFERNKPPRIDVYDASPGSSPDARPDRRGSAISENSDLETSTTNVRSESRRLNSILGIPGHLGPLHMSALGALEARRPSLAGKRQWSISDGRSPSTHRTPMTRRKIARVRALLLSSGVKAQEITRRSLEMRDIREPETDALFRRKDIYSDIAALVSDREDKLLLKPVQRKQEHLVIAKILSNDIQFSSRAWQDCVENFSSSTVGTLLDKVEELQQKIVGENGLSDLVKTLADQADDVSKDLVEDQTASSREITRRMERLMRRRRQRFRWVRRAGWVALEWVLVGVMWWVWALVVVARIILGTVATAGRIGRWLLWL